MNLPLGIAHLMTLLSNSVYAHQRGQNPAGGARCWTWRLLRHYDELNQKGKPRLYSHLRLIAIVVFVWTINARGDVIYTLDDPKQLGVVGEILHFHGTVT